MVYRRTLIRGIGGGIGALSIAGITTAERGVRYLAVTDDGGTARRIESAGFDVERSLANDTVHSVWGSANAASELEDVSGVQRVTADRRLELERPIQEIAADVDEPTAYDDLLWDKQTIESLEANEHATGEGASVAVIDTGIDYEHPEVGSNLDADAGRLFREGEIRSGVGEVAVPESYADALDPAHEGPVPVTTETFHVADEQQGHGTHVAGIATASDGRAVIGTAPDADVVSLRVFWWFEDEDGDATLATTTADVLNAIDHAAEHGYDAANLSLGTAPIEPREMRDEAVRTMRQGYQRVVQHALNQGTVVVASAGNSETRLRQRGLFSLPNSVPGALSVSATGPNDELAFYSDHGTGEIDVGAPGGGYETLEKTLAADTEWPYPTNLVFSSTSERVEGEPYGWKAGTSMAAPQVAGLVALVRELEPDAGPRQVESAIKHGAEEVTGRSDPELGAGRINALRTVERL